MALEEAGQSKRSRWLGGASAAALLMLGATSAAAQEVRVTDILGEQIVLAAPAQRIAPLGTTTTLAVVVAGGTDRIVGSGAPTTFGNMLGVIYPEGAELPVIGGMANTPPNTEEIAALDPDVVILWNGEGGASHDSAPLSNAGLTVARWGSGTEERMDHSIQMIADLIGEPERGEAIVEWRTGIGERLAELTADIADGERQRALGFWPSGSEGAFSVYGGGADDPYGNYFYRAGAVNVAENGPSVQTANAEQLALYDADVIFVWANATSDYGLEVV